jgi:Kef-type K+ transport system membrane component KefB
MPLPTTIPPLALIAAEPEGAKVALAILLVFGGAKLMAEVFERLGQPGIVGEILVGVIIGPSVLGWIGPNAVLTALSELGVMFLLFRVGLEVKSRDLVRVGPTALLVATLGVLVPFLLGWGILAWWGAPHIESIFVGAAMVATSVGITAQVLASKGLLHHVASQTILAAAVIDDVLGLLVLAVVSSMARGKVNLLELAGTALGATGFTVVIAKWGTGAMVRVLPRVEARLRAGNVQFNLAMILLFGLALLATYAGVAAIIGAFLAGMALSESLEPRVYSLVDGVTELLLPFFLVTIGLHLELAPFAHASTLALAGVIIVAAVASKLVGCGLGALRMGFANALRVGCGMAPRGEVGMVVAQIGLGLGVIADSIYGVVVFMAVATTLIAPPLINASFRNAVREAAVEEFRVQ